MPCGTPSSSPLSAMGPRYRVGLSLKYRCHSSYVRFWPIADTPPAWGTLAVLRSAFDPKRTSAMPTPKATSWLDWKHLSWRRRGFLLATTILLVYIASSPVLASVVPVLDAVGIDALLYLFTAQLSVILGRMALPFGRSMCGQWVGSIMRCVAYAFGFCIGGYLRELAWNTRHAGSAVCFAGMPSRRW